jgi:nucleotide-binding universal stress UspA family protein
MFQGSRVVVASDLTEGSDEAVVQAHTWALAASSELVACHIVPNALHNNILFPHNVQLESLNLIGAEREAEQLLIDQVRDLTGRGKDPPRPAGAPASIPPPAETFTIAIDNGAPDAGIVETAEQFDACLLVVGAGEPEGDKGSMLGTVSDRVIRYAHCPVLVARRSQGSHKIVVATDFSEKASPAVEAGVEASKLLGAQVTLLHCIDIEPSQLVSLGVPFGATPVTVPPAVMEEVDRNAHATLQGLKDRLGIDGEVRVVNGTAAESIVQTARELEADLIVMGTSGRTGLARIALGSTAETVAGSAPCSVLVVRARKQA